MAQTLEQMKVEDNKVFDVPIILNPENLDKVTTKLWQLPSFLSSFGLFGRHFHYFSFFPSFFLSSSSFLLSCKEERAFAPSLITLFLQFL